MLAGRWPNPIPEPAGLRPAPRIASAYSCPFCARPGRPRCAPSALAPAALHLYPFGPPSAAPGDPIFLNEPLFSYAVVWYYARMNTDTAVPDCSQQTPKPWLFQPGQSGNPRGRPPGCGGRARALQILDEVGNREDNAKLLSAAFDTAMKMQPLQFFMKVMAPLLPKEALLRVENKAASVGPWVSLLEVCRYREIEKRAIAAGIEMPPPVQRLRHLGQEPEGEK